MLFPDEEDSLLYDSSDAYRRLTPVEKAIVRQCLVEIYVNCRWPTQTSVAKAAGVSRTTVQKYLSDKSNLVHTAISQISAAHGGEMCKRCRDIIPQIAMVILWGIKAGRSTATLTPTEYNLLKLATEMGGIPLSMAAGAPPVNVNIAAQSTGDGARVGVQISTGEQDALSEYLSKLCASQRMQPGPGPCGPSGQSATPAGRAGEGAPGGPPDGLPEALPVPAGAPSEAVPETAPGPSAVPGGIPPETVSAVESG
jgi:hypothetical protein